MAKDKKIIQLHNNFVEAVYSLNVEAKKILLSVILHLNDDNKIEIHRSELIEEIGLDPRKIKHLKAVFKELMSKIIEIKSLENPENWELYQLLMATKYENGILKTSIYPELLPYFQEAKKRLFTRFNIQNIKPLTSIHAIRLYELCKRYEDTGWYEVSIQDFKKMMKLEEKYKIFADFRRKVLEVAKKQINENTDINIAYKLIKEGRAYKKIRFTISKNRQKVERVTNKKLIEKGEFEELEERLNKEYKNKVAIAKDGIKWIVKSIKVLNENKVEVIVTDTVKEEKVKKNINDLSNTFK